MPGWHFVIDGGGSKTLARLHRHDGGLLGEVRGGPANLYQDRGRSVRQILDLWSELTLERPDIEAGETVLAAGLAGLDAPGTLPYLETHLPSFKRLLIINDAEAAFMAAFGDQAGCLIIVGTGVAAIRRRVAGGPLELIGGWGFPIHDQGGGAWLGAELIRHYLAHLDGYPVAASPALDAVEIEIGRTRDAILAWLEGAKPADFARLVPAVLGGHDALSEQLIERSLAHIELLAQSLEPSPGQPLCMAGGLTPVLAPRLRSILGEHVMPKDITANPLDGLLQLAQNDG